MLDAIEQLLPISVGDWNHVSQDYSERARLSGFQQRDVSALKRKWLSLLKARPPTGSSTPPSEVTRALQIDGQIRVLLGVDTQEAPQEAFPEELGEIVEEDSLDGDGVIDDNFRREERAEFVGSAGPAPLATPTPPPADWNQIPSQQPRWEAPPAPAPAPARQNTSLPRPLPARMRRGSEPPTNSSQRSSLPAGAEPLFRYFEPEQQEARGLNAFLMARVSRLEKDLQSVASELSNERRHNEMRIDRLNEIHAADERELQRISTKLQIYEMGQGSSRSTRAVRASPRNSPARNR